MDYFSTLPDDIILEIITFSSYSSPIFKRWSTLFNKRVEFIWKRLDQSTKYYLFPTTTINNFNYWQSLNKIKTTLTKGIKKILSRNNQPQALEYYLKEMNACSFL